MQSLQLVKSTIIIISVDHLELLTKTKPALLNQLGHQYLLKYVSGSTWPSILANLNVTHCLKKSKFATVECIFKYLCLCLCLYADYISSYRCHDSHDFSFETDDKFLFAKFKGFNSKSLRAFNSPFQ